MPWSLHHHPPTLLKNEVDGEKVPAIRAKVKMVLRNLGMNGPDGCGRPVTSLSGSKYKGIKKINLKVNGVQVRILFMVSGERIILLGVHRKSSPQEQTRAHDRAAARMKEVERILEKGDDLDVTIH